MEISDEIKLKELEIKKLELELKKAEVQNQKSILLKIFNPFSTSILVAIVGGLYSIYNINKQKQNEIELSRQQYEQKLYSEAMNSGSLEKACEIIKFYNTIGQLRPNNKIFLCSFENKENQSVGDTLDQGIEIALGYSNDSSISQPDINPQQKVIIPILNNQSNFRKDAELASIYEYKGFNLLLQDDVSGAIESFQKAEQTYPSYHNAYEISTFLSNNRNKDINSLKKTIKEKYSWGAPKEIIDKY